MLKKMSRTDDEKQKGRLIPSGELKCVWMTAGVVSYKLCNHGFECETCPFDQSMRREKVHASESPAPGDEAVYRTLSADSFACLGDLQCPENRDDEVLFRPFQSLRIQKTYLYHRGHTWADISNRHMVKIGIDDFAGTCLPEVKTIILPARKNRIDQGQVCCWIVIEDGTLPILAPLTGTMVDANPRLAQQQNLIRKTPYEQGWLMHIEPEDLHRDLANLYGEDRACAVCQEDVRKLTQTFVSALHAHGDQLGPTLQDGGTAFIHLREAVGPGRYYEIIAPFFMPQGK
jgi:glycine cleavage system H protein